MKIVYYSGSGNTEKMANLIAEGIKEEGKNSGVNQCFFSRIRCF